MIVVKFKKIFFLQLFLIVLILLSSCNSNSIVKESDFNESIDSNILDQNKDKQKSDPNFIISDILPNEDIEEIVDKTSIKEVREFVDSLDRVILVPKNIEKISVISKDAQFICYSLSPDSIISIANSWSKDFDKFSNLKISSLPISGDIYSENSIIDFELINKLNPDVIINIGNNDNINEKINLLQKETSIPIIHIDYSFNNISETYKLMGDLLEKEDEADVLSTYLEDIYIKIKNIVSNKEIQKKKIIYINKENLQYNENLATNQIINIVGKNSIKEVITNKEIDFNKIEKVGVDVIFYEKNSYLDNNTNKETLKGYKLINNKQFFLIPSSPYSIISNENCINNFLGLSWICNILYSEECDYSIQEEYKNYFNLFYHYKISNEEISTILN
ncbi:MAG: ABC transporter substrate-binding protein [Eubacteriales bacterium]|nr:ABC transporter substrate-binding protein [Eubacteriales bacterium]